MATRSLASQPDQDGDALELALDRMDRLSHALVLLDDRPFPDLSREILGFAAMLLEHVQGSDSHPLARKGEIPATDATPEGIRLDHDRFRVSAEELRNLLDLVRRDDHGGHRQALGQYGRLLVESLRCHRAEERDRGPASARTGPSPPDALRVANRKEAPGERAIDR